LSQHGITGCCLRDLETLSPANRKFSYS